MASRSSKNQGKPRRPQSTQRKFFSAISAISAVYVFAAAGLGAQAPDRARAEALARRATERLQSLQREADRLASQESTVLGDLRRLEIERQLRGEELKRLESDATTVEADLAASTERME